MGQWSGLDELHGRLGQFHRRTLSPRRQDLPSTTHARHLFHDTVAANLRYARSGATDEELMAACRSARIYDLIAGLPDGFDTLVG